jgi:hypothetical protein
MHTRPLAPVVSLLRTASSAVLAGALLLGCATQGELVEGADYPRDLPRAKILDIQVTRAETEISLSNTTAAPIPAGKLWLNAWYVRDFPGLGIGESITLDLHEFHDRYGDEFRAGGFWATDRPDKLALAQIEANGELLGLICVTQGGL